MAPALQGSFYIYVAFEQRVPIRPHIHFWIRRGKGGGGEVINSSFDPSYTTINKKPGGWTFEVCFVRALLIYLAPFEAWYWFLSVF
jgi:hypothetical protein